MHHTFTKLPLSILGISEVRRKSHSESGSYDSRNTSYTYEYSLRRMEVKLKPMEIKLLLLFMYAGGAAVADAHWKPPGAQ